MYPGKMYLEKDLALNRVFAFGTLYTNSEAVPGGPQVCKLNGELSMNYSDLLLPAGKTPRFAQAYVVTAATSADHRCAQAFPDMKCRKNLATAQDLIQKIEDTLRLTHPYAELFKTAHDQWKEAEQKAKDENATIPKFQLTLLNNRKAREARIADPYVHPHRTDMPQGVEHVGMIWISAEGTPPEYSGIRLDGREGKIVTIAGHNINAITFPTFFPLLNPHGLLGYRFGIPLKAVTLESATQDQLLQDCADDEEQSRRR